MIGLTNRKDPPRRTGFSESRKRWTRVSTARFSLRKIAGDIRLIRAALRNLFSLNEKGYKRKKLIGYPRPDSTLRCIGNLEKYLLSCCKIQNY